MVGPLARFNLNFPQLAPLAREVATSIGLVPPVRNPFKSILCRGVEILHACEEALHLIERYEPPERPQEAVAIQAGTGYGASEAPRGILYHRYQINSQGLIEDAKIVTPTAQNQRRIEDDLRKLVPSLLSLTKEEITWRCEQAIRNYDPCISCATHFLKVHIDSR